MLNTVELLFWDSIHSLCKLCNFHICFLFLKWKFVIFSFISELVCLGQGKNSLGWLFLKLPCINEWDKYFLEPRPLTWTIITTVKHTQILTISSDCNLTAWECVCEGYALYLQCCHTPACNFPATKWVWEKEKKEGTWWAKDGGKGMKLIQTNREYTEG